MMENIKEFEKMEISWENIGKTFALWFIIFLILGYFSNIQIDNFIDFIITLLKYQESLFNASNPLAIDGSLFSVMILTGIPLGYYFSKKHYDIEDVAGISLLFGGVSCVLLVLVVSLIIVIISFLLHGNFYFGQTYDLVFVYTIKEWIIIVARFSVISGISGLIANYAVK